MGLQVHQISFETLTGLLTSCGVEAESCSNKNDIEENPHIHATGKKSYNINYYYYY